MDLGSALIAVAVAWAAVAWRWVRSLERREALRLEQSRDASIEELAGRVAALEDARRLDSLHRAGSRR